MHNSTYSSGGRKQRGWVLVIGLVVLVMLSIIAIALMRTTLLEEKMAGATRDINLSFQAAETALWGAERFIDNQPSESAFKWSDPGLYAKDDSEPSNLFSQSNWDLETDAIEYDDATLVRPDGKGVSAEPRYMIKIVGESGDEGSLNIGGYGETDLSQKSVIYRITARGTGGNDNTQTVLRSHYARAY